VGGKKERSDVGRQFAALRRKVKLACAVCGKVVTGLRKRRYCSAACRQEAFRRRRRQAGDSASPGT
jgi:hypothetical protein